ncbi:MAG: hypothetical protein JJ895_15555 [Balneolaceae bacterium]|nr:hypothetical protein [Balneolaceae bacterium]
MNILKSDNVRGYFIYALGEVLLVVIGILIAVSINNWNEDRKEKAELLSIYSVVKQDLANDVAEINDILRQHSQIEPVFNQILEDSLSYDDFNKMGLPSFVILGYPEISFDQRGFHLLRDFNASNEGNQDSTVVSIIEFYTERMLEIKVDDDFRAQDFEDNYIYWKNNHSWWNEYVTMRDFSGFATYATTGSDYKNRVASFYFLTYQVYLPELQLFVEQAKELISDIEKIETN